MKLTNEQMKIYTDFVYNKIEKKVEALLCQENNPYIAKVKEILHYDEVLPIVTRIEELSNQIEELHNSRMILINSYKNIIPISTYITNGVCSVSISKLEEDIKYEAKRLALKDFPSRSDIKMSILENSIIENGKEFIKKVLTKFNLEEE